MTNEDETYDPAAGPGASGATNDEVRPGTEDSTMAAGPRSGAAGVANAEMGTSGAPAQAMLSPEELARVEADGGGGLDPSALSEEALTEYFGEGHTGV